uniref:MUTSd domain-containing protein n=1 Tax=Heterorhabditis bacteriophora TaxID=37862 RepID=A0A1I7WVH0_HETBA
MLSAVPKEALTPKKQFLTPEDTVKMLMQDEFLGGDHSDWPLVLRSMLDTESVLAKPDSNNYLALGALGAVLNYLKRCMIDVDMVTMRHFERFEPSICIKKIDSACNEKTWTNRQLVLDGVTLDNLNLIPCDKRDPQAASVSLFNTINKCFTAFGKRLLRQWICSPTCNANSIRERQQAVEWLMSPGATPFIEKATELLRRIPDLERLLQKIHTFGLKYRADSHPDGRAVMFEASKYNKRKIKDLLVTLDGFENCQKLFVLYNEYRMDENRCSFLDSCIGFDESDFGCYLQFYKESFNRVLAEKDGIIVPDRKRDADYDMACNNVEDCVKQLELYKVDQEKNLGCKIGFHSSGKNRYQLEIPDSKTLSHLYELKGRRKGFGRYVTLELEGLIQNLVAAEADKHRLADDATRKIFADFDSRLIIKYDSITRLCVHLQFLHVSTNYISVKYF